MVARLARLWPALLLLAALSGAPAQSLTGSYVNGVEGIKGASLPPPGIYYRMYNVFYHADSFRNTAGNDAGIGFNVNVYAMAHRVIWITKKKFLGGYYGMDAILPFVNTDVSVTAAGIDDRRFGLGDIWVEPITLSWHGKWWDAAVGLGTYIPTGNFDPTQAASAGKGFWSPMATYGATVYFDPAKTWSASLLGRYEIHTANTDVNITPGNDLHFEWAVGKSFMDQDVMWELGAAGYCQWQTTNDSGAGAAAVKVRDKVMAIGPELNLTIPNSRLNFQLRSLWEFGAEDRPQGNLTNFTITGWF